VASPRLAVEPTRRTAPALRERYLREGFWNDDTLGGLIARGVAAAPSAEVRIWSEIRPFRGRLSDVYGLSLGLAGWLRSRGLGPGDAIAYQLPNWMEAAASLGAISALGAIAVPIVHYYGARELEYILSRTHVRALIVASRFGRQELLANLASVRGRLPELEQVVVVAGAGGSPGPGLVSFEAAASAAPLAGPLPVDPEEPCIVGFTSGTTADPKGVIHTHRTFLGELRQQLTLLPAEHLPILVAAPAAHAIGLFGGLLMPLARGRPIHLTDVWKPESVLAAMLEANLTAGSGATVFLTTLLDAPGFSAEHARRMPFAGLGGSPVPAPVCERAEARGIAVSRSYGSTEHPSITGSTPELPREKRNTTDGRPLPGVELRLVSEDARELGVGEPGEIVSRGPDLFAGYTDPALTARAVDADGWYHTGDVGVRDADGFVVITDRKSDIIIRGGSNLSAAEIEEQLLRMPGLAEVAVVAAPDPRLGERACAVVRLSPGAPEPSLSQVLAHLERCELPRPKWPERLCVVEEFPRTPSGKIQKFELRRRLREEGGLAR